MEFKKRGLSAVISTLLIVLVAFVLTAIIWASISKLVDDRKEESEACFDSFGKIEINREYTCYDKDNNRLRFGIDRKDFDLDGVLVSVSSEGKSHSFTIEAEEGSVGGVSDYLGQPVAVSLPGKSSGTSYYLDLALVLDSGVPTSIRIAPVIGDHTCEESDKLMIIDACTGS